LDGRETKYDEYVRRNRGRFEGLPYGWNDLRVGRHYGGRAWDIPTHTHTTITYPVQNPYPYRWDDLTQATQDRIALNTYTTVTAAVYPTVTWTHPAYNTTTIGDWTVTRDEMWAGWTVGNTTTGTYTTIADEDMARFEGTGVTWDVGWHQMGDALTHAGEAARHVAEQWRGIQQRTVPTAEQLQEFADREQRAREERARRALEQEQRYAAAQEARIMAEARGGELLQMLLTPEQKQSLRDRHIIPVRGSQGGMYEIDTLQNGVHGNIVQVDQHGCRLGRICVAPGMREADGRVLPLADGWVGQLLAIMADEEHFRNTGNWSSPQVCRHPDVPILERAA